MWIDRIIWVILYDVENDFNDGGFFFLDEVIGLGYLYGVIFV